MNSSLILFGLLPVAAFLLLGARGNSRKALWGALALGAFEVGYSIAVAGIDYLTLCNFIIMAVFIWASLRKGDDYFFKIHGAVANIATALVMLVAWYGFHKAMLLDGVEKYIGMDKLAELNPKLDREQTVESLRILSLHMPVWLLIHAALTMHAAARWSRWAWGMVYVPGLFVAIFLAILTAQISALEPPR
jgi:intracellular septation protein A